MPETDIEYLHPRYDAQGSEIYSDLWGLRQDDCIGLAVWALCPWEQRYGIFRNDYVDFRAGKRGWANAAAYCASKFGLTGLTQALAAEAKDAGVRVCIVYPGAMATNWGVWQQKERQRAESLPRPADALPPADVAALIVWIASAPPEVVLNEAIVTPLQEYGWP